LLVIVGVAGWAWLTLARVSASLASGSVYTCTCVHDNILCRRLLK